ncbi:hypothetical protein Tsubulata_020386, partial [Turnera subulata]
TQVTGGQETRACKRLCLLKKILDKGEGLSNDDLSATLNSSAANSCVDSCEKILCAQSVHRTDRANDVRVPVQDEIFLNGYKLHWFHLLEEKNQRLEDEKKKLVKTQKAEMRSCQRVCILMKMLNKDEASWKDYSTNIGADASICGNACERMLYAPMATGNHAAIRHYL